MTVPLTVSKDPPLGLFLPEIVILDVRYPEVCVGMGSERIWEHPFGGLMVALGFRGLCVFWRVK